MFTQLRVKNFKAWQGEHKVDLAPLCLFLGTNSAGKTSLLQMLLLLKQTAESPDRRQHLNLGGQPDDLLHLGAFRDIISGHDLNRELTVGLHLTGSLATKSQRSADFDSSDAEDWVKVIILTESQRSADFDYDVSFCRARGGAPVVKSLTYCWANRIFRAARQPKGAYELTAAVAGDSAPSAIVEHPSAKRSKSYEPERSIAFSAAAVAALGLDGAKVQDLALQMVQALKGIVYLGPLRERPQRVYPWNLQAPGDLGNKGELAIQALLASANARSKPTETGGRGRLVQQVSRWLKAMDVADGLKLEQEGQSVHYQVIVQNGKIEANLVDVGFGVSQVLPVVTLAYFVLPGSTVILEQPEIHLHPLAQTALANLLVEVSKTRRVQFLVETHSEHLFRRLQSLIAEEQVSPEDCRLYFVKKGEEGAALERLEVDDYGRVKNWPVQFFGDAIGEMERQARRRIERMAKRQRD